MTEIKECPFCGSKVKLKKLDKWDYCGADDMYEICCNKCNFYFARSGENARDSLIYDWNRRCTGWISVKTSLPEIGQEVLTYRPDAVKGNDSVIDIVKFIGEPGVYGHCFDRVWEPTHWQPLPKIPMQG